MSRTIALTLGLALAGTAQAQQPPPAAEPGSELTVSVITMGQGQAIYERFGHNAIRVTDARSGSDITYNYGMFDFAQENFILRFIQGRMLYWMAAHAADREIAGYVRANRSVWEQELNLTAAQKVALRDFLEWNAREENRFYRYDYYLDNCSTRVRDAIDSVLGGAIRSRTARAAAGATYRSHTRRLTSNGPVMYTGLNIGLGPPTDRPISQWEEMFLPLAVREHLRTITVPAPGGGTRPLVRVERTLFTSSTPESPDAPPRWWPFYLAAGLVLGSALLFAGARIRHSAAARFAFGFIGGVWGLAAGTAGLILAGLWALTDHSAAHANQNLFQLSPLSLPLALLLPLLASRPERTGTWTRRIAVAAALLAVAGLVWKLLPAAQQVNGEIIALALPLHLAIAIAVWRGTRATPPPAVSALRPRPR